MALPYFLIEEKPAFEPIRKGGRSSAAEKRQRDRSNRGTSTVRQRSTAGDYREFRALPPMRAIDQYNADLRRAPFGSLFTLEETLVINHRPVVIANVWFDFVDQEWMYGFGPYDRLNMMSETDLINLQPTFAAAQRVIAFAQDVDTLKRGSRRTDIRRRQYATK